MSVGNFKAQTISPTTFNFENTLSHVQGEEKSMFIKFIKRIVTWNPDERSTAKELLQDPWLYEEIADD